ncbi:hybrid sensor histidine kinase/response regulator [Magnetococcales bacterium HHB-1]
MIEDLELRDLFKAESEEHLEKLDNGLLHLEKNPDDAEMLKELFREAHSLKGAARMLGVSDVETLAHHFEDLLGAASRKEINFSSELIDRLIQGLDDIRGFVNEAVTGEAAGIAVFEALSRMKEEGSSTPKPKKKEEPKPPPPAKESPKEPEPVRFSQPTPSPPEPVRFSSSPSEEKRSQETKTPQPMRFSRRKPETQPEPPQDPPKETKKIDPPADEKEEGKTEEREISPEQPYRIDTIRVKPQKLDKLLNQAGELTVVKTRVSRRLKEIELGLQLWEESAHALRQNNRQENLLKDEESQRQQDRALNDLERLGDLLQTLQRSMFEDEAGMEIVARELEEGIRNLRLLPLSTLFNLFPRMIRDLSRQITRQKGEQKEIELIIEGGETSADKQIIEEMKSPLMHLIRNAVDHAMEYPKERQALGKPAKGTLKLSAWHTATHVVIELKDDGKGINREKLRQKALNRKLYNSKQLDAMSDRQLINLIFVSGLSTKPVITDISGRGVGLDAVRSTVESLKGSVQVESIVDKGTTFTIKLPVTLATTPVFIVSASDKTFALPLDHVHSVRRINSKEIFPIEGRQTIALHDDPISIAPLTQLLELPQGGLSSTWSQKNQDSRPCIILQVGEELLGILVDEIIDEQEILMKPHGSILKRVRNIQGATILGTGEVCMVINAPDLIKAVQQHTSPAPFSDDDSEDQQWDEERKPIILLVEDSITTRTQEKRILEGAGYEVVTAVDGKDALLKLPNSPFDAVVSDVEMPNMTGLELAAEIRKEESYKELPIILVTSLSTEEDQRRGMEAGANAYITKTTFDQRRLLDALRRLA